ncbi:MAG: Unknown protein [uncultured Sulfurovum sp.]|uniref:Uncharacterized protein n=1 Tax=uncultured Sulfurovum sp. TaxID=269237 RepID=A0A6S6U342_9BACT|nr:MAG: Unknown protein [uncultured Sulfurovum sp.]
MWINFKKVDEIFLYFVVTKNGDHYWARTNDIFHVMEALYQLS